MNGNGTEISVESLWRSDYVTTLLKVIKLIAYEGNGTEINVAALWRSVYVPTLLEVIKWTAYEW
jgi:hypothetical protein